MLMLSNYNTEAAKRELAQRKLINRSWNAMEIVAFKQGLATYGKRFHKFPKRVVDRSVKEIVDFYYNKKKKNNFKKYIKHFSEGDISGDDSTDENNDVPAVVENEQNWCSNCGTTGHLLTLHGFSGKMLCCDCYCYYSTKARRIYALLIAF
ncbi:unnamed protein product [Gongylonema pulchrum]|uniref:SANT domain-containing protein n=1 Tax=Gongylonema pulchrum TaxID=637853 RepID=A0A183DNI6_9BILA|nr:unnamed protein product [Gongylonema pulchrum]